MRYKPGDRVRVKSRKELRLHFGVPKTSPTYEQYRQWCGQVVTIHSSDPWGGGSYLIEEWPDEDSNPPSWSQHNAWIDDSFEGLASSYRPLSELDTANIF